MIMTLCWRAMVTSLRRRSSDNVAVVGLSIEGTTYSQFAKARHWRAFRRVLAALSPRARLVGWRRSADRTGLQANSLLTGNFTGKFAISGLRDAPLKPKVAVLQRL